MSEDTKQDETIDPRWRQDQTPNLQKAMNPDSDYMKDRNLCVRCHGVANDCGRLDCPQRRE